MVQSKGKAIPVKEKLLDRYQIKEVLGDNGFSITYRGYDNFRDKKVIIKELFPGKIVRRIPEENYKVECVRLANESVFDSMKEQVIQEAKALIQLYPLNGIANMITFFEANQTVYTVSEYIEGVTLDVFLSGKKTSKLPLNSLLNFFEPLTESLKEVHGAGIVHGKIRPNQIMVTKKNGAKLIGFGDPMKAAIYPLFVEEMLSVRNSRYTPVELFMEEGILSAATDVYGLAATIYHCITGIIPPHFYDRIQNTEVMKTPLELNIPVEEEQGNTLMKGLASHDFERFETIEEFLNGFVVEGKEEEKKPPKPIVLYKEPFVFLKRKRGLYVKEILAIIVMIVIICLIPTGVRSIRNYQVNHFYENFVNASHYEKCLLLRDVSEKERDKYANDYNVMDENEDITVKYYDCNKKSVVTKEEMDISQRNYCYISIDFRQEKRALVTYYEPDAVTTWDINLLKTEEYFKATRTVSKNGRVIEAEDLQILPTENIELP